MTPAGKAPALRGSSAATATTPASLWSAPPATAAGRTRRMRSPPRAGPGFRAALLQPLQPQLRVLPVVAGHPRHAAADRKHLPEQPLRLVPFFELDHPTCDVGASQLRR